MLDWHGVLMLFHIFGQADETNCSKQGSNPSPTPEVKK
jgi:hypothetical protein